MAGAAQEGNAELWLEQHGDALYGYAMMRVRDSSAAEDLVQETLLAAWSARGAFKAEASVRTWLVGIIKNKTADHFRKQGRERTVDALPADDAELAVKFDGTGHWIEPPASWSDPAFMAENAQLRAALTRCIDALPDNLRRLFVLREIDGYDTAELLEMLAISSANNLWVMLSRGRERVRACLDVSWHRSGRR